MPVTGKPLWHKKGLILIMSDIRFIALDGEGHTLESGEHIYTLLSGGGEFIYNPEGLRTFDCIEFIINLKTQYPKAVFVSFYFSYDVNMILGNIPPEYIEMIKETNRCYLYHKTQYGFCHKVEYLPRKYFKCMRANRLKDSTGKVILDDKINITVWDVFGFFQSSFVSALKQFNIGTKEEWEILTDMKDKRSSFIDESFDDILSYNMLECKLLEDLMGKLNDALVTAGINLKSWHGAGAIAGELMRRYNVKSHISPFSKSLNTPVLSAYFGGRIQAFIIGNTNQEVFSHDIVSAYPSAMVNLPSLKNHIARKVKKYNNDLPFTCWHVKWDLLNPVEPIDEKYYSEDGDYKSVIIPPFPFRTKDGRIHYPLIGEGYYWDKEIPAAIGMYGNNIEVLEGYQIIHSKDDKPFNFIPELFEQRKRFKREGNFAQLAIKLGLNSLYGKTAQGVGFDGRVPAYQSYVYSGMITSETRAKILELCAISPRDIIAIATDGVLSTKQLTEELNKDLGTWEVDKYDSVFNVKPGFYRAIKDGKEYVKVRGFRLSEINFDELLTLWETENINGEIVIPIEQFIGLKIASENRPWRRWIKSSKTMSLMPSNGIPQLLTLKPLRFRILPDLEFSGKSMEYKPEIFKNSDGDDIETEVI
jgi:hypothetical protein